jgi:hypothetical protein
MLAGSASFRVCFASQPQSRFQSAKFARADQVVPIFKAAFFILFLSTVPTTCFAQFFEVNGPFDAGKYQPLTGRERFHRWWEEDGASPALHEQSIGSALYLQIINDPPAWKRTGGGLIRRIGSSYGANLIQNSAHETFAAAEGTDPRYFACGCSGFFHRSGHALKMTFLTYDHNGHKTLDSAQLAGAYGGSIIEATWWPHHYSAFAQGVQTGHIDVGFIGAVHLLQEFSPEFKRLVHWRESASSTP